ncbi:flagellar biosynthesis protein FliQ [Candidatus Latescibacterota bacterium]
MSTTYVIQTARDAIIITLLMASPMLGFGLLVGLTVSILQAVTQVNEMTLTFIPKIIAVVLAFALFLPWIMQIIVDFTTILITRLPYLSP